MIIPLNENSLRMIHKSLIKYFDIDDGEINNELCDDLILTFNCLIKNSEEYNMNYIITEA